MLRLLLPTCFVVHSADAWVAPAILSAKTTPSKTGGLGIQESLAGRSAVDNCHNKFARTRSSRNRVLRANAASDDNQGSFTFEDEDCLDLCDLSDSDDIETISSSTAFDTSQEKRETSSLTKEQQQQLEQLEGEKQKVRLEMHWELQQMKDECDVQDASTCSDTCDECRGVGHITCRFCRGVKSISLAGGKANVSCPVCDEAGEEVCHKCRGSGRVAPWTELADFNPQL